jgi:hypothetical protein
MRPSFSSRRVHFAADHELEACRAVPDERHGFAAIAVAGELAQVGAGGTALDQLAQVIAPAHGDLRMGWGKSVFVVSISSSPGADRHGPS